MISVPLDKSRHDRKRFDCGIEALNNYLRVMANQQALKDHARTYVLESPALPAQIMGFYTLTIVPIDTALLPQPLKTKQVKAGGLIARLAVDLRHQGKGYGEWLLMDALKKLLSASKIVGFPIVIVDAKDGASGFYQTFGFTPFNHNPNKLFITIAMLRKSLG